MYDITSIDALIAALDGPSILGANLGISQEAVSNWGIRKSIPGGWHMQLASMLLRKGLTIDPHVFNLTEEDVEGLFPKRPLESEVAA